MKMQLSIYNDPSNPIIRLGEIVRPEVAAFVPTNVTRGDVDGEPTLKQFYVEPELPEGIWELKGGKFAAECCICGKNDEIHCDISEIPMTGYTHYCGSGQGCCP